MFQLWRRSASIPIGETSELLPPEYAQARIPVFDGHTAAREAICHNVIARREADHELCRLRETGAI